MKIGPHLWAAGADGERELRNVFAWLTRSGIGVRFGSRPIAWYQQHQVAAIEALEERAVVAGVIADPRRESFDVRVRGNEVIATGAGRRWKRLGTVAEVFRDAEENA